MTVLAAKALQIRKPDAAGDGAFGSGRGKKFHRGIDLACEAGALILAPVSGMVTKVGYPYTPKRGDKITYRYVQIEDDQGRQHRIFYVNPRVEVGNLVSAKSDKIGVAQDICARMGRSGKTYGEQGMTNHIHYEVIEDGEYINPAEWALP